MTNKKTTKRYPSGRLLYLKDVNLRNLKDMVPARVDIIPGFYWSIYNDGSGSINGPDGTYCEFDLQTHELKLDAHYGWQRYEDLSLSTLQTFGEDFLRTNVFNKYQNARYDTHLVVLQNTLRYKNHKVREAIGKHIQLELRDGSYRGYVDADGIAQYMNEPLNKTTMTREETIQLFNDVSLMNNIAPLVSPDAYLTREDNVYDYLRDTYTDVYENTLQDIYDNIVDGTGYGVQHVLNDIPNETRKLIRSFINGTNSYGYGELRFVEATDDMKDLIDDFVKARVALSIMREKSRSYDPETVKMRQNRFDTLKDELGDNIRKVLSKEPSRYVELSDDDLSDLENKNSLCNVR